MQVIKRLRNRDLPFIGHNLNCSVCITQELSCCVNHGIYELDSLLYDVRQQILSLAEKLNNFAKYGYSRFDQYNNLKKFSALKAQKDTLENHIYSLKKGLEPCLSCNQIQLIMENIRSTIPCDIIIRKDIDNDTSNKESWNKSNPYCVSREKWEELVYRVCDDLGFDIKVISFKNLCDITFETSINPLFCDIIFDIRKRKKECELNYNIKISEKNCKLDFKILKESTSCDLDYETYRKLINCKLTSKIIKDVYSCDMKLVLDKDREDCAILFTTAGTGINLCDMNINIETNLINNPNC
jgi:hypothetical protein